MGTWFGNTLDMKTTIGPVHSKVVVKKFEETIHQAIQQGGKVIGVAGRTTTTQGR